MRELRLKYIIQMVSDIGTRATSDQRALTMAQQAVQEALKKTSGEAGAVERVLLRLGGVSSKSAQDQAAYLARLAMRWQDVRRQAEGAAAAMKTAQAVGAGAAAGAYALDRVAKTPMDYSARLAQMANTAYAERDVAGRISGKKALNAAITAAIRSGGGSRDDAAATLDSLIASGAVPIDAAIKLLPTLMRGSTASGASAEQLGSIAMRGMQSFGIQVDQVPELLNMAMAAGQAGGFELRDMSKWLPEAMALGRNSGLSGMEGMRRILASMQASVITAGTKDGAGNNVVNLLGKINSRDTAHDFEKATGIDLSARLAKDRGKGINALDSFIGLVDGVVQRDPEYRKLQKRLASATGDDERKATQQSMVDILQGKAIGTVIQDRQAMMALVAEMNNREYVQRVMKTTRESPGAMGTSFEVMSQETAFKRQQALNEAAVAGSEAFDRVAPALGAVAETATNAAQRFPLMTAGVVGATAALGVFTAALGASGLIGLLTGRAGNAGGVIGTAATMSAGAVASAVKLPFAATSAGAVTRMAGAALGPLAALGLDAYAVSQDQTLSDAGRRRGYAGAAAGAAGGWAGAAGGAALGTMILPGVGTAVGGVLGGIGGYLSGKGALNWLWGQDPARDLAGPGGEPLSQAGALQLGKGQLEVNVRVQDDRTSTSTRVTQPMDMVRIDSGATNPGGY